MKKSIEQKFYPSEVLKKALKYFDEISFSQKNAANETHDFLIAEGEGDRFTIRRLSNETFEIINNSPSLHNLYVDAFCLLPGQKLSLGSKTVFIYNSSPESPDEYTTVPFIYGFDPIEIEIWEITETDKGCTISARNFTKKYRVTKEKYVGVENINFEIRPAEFVGLYGKSGVGKSVLIESFISPKDTGMKKKSKDEISSGDLFINQKDTRLSTDCVAFLPQKIQFPKLVKCRELLKIGMADRHNHFPNNTQYMEEILKLCTLSPEILNEKYGKLSGGQQRRLALAMALLDKRIHLLIVDEPTSGLDIVNEMEIMRALRKLSRSMGITVIVLTHAIAALRMFDRVMVLRENANNHGATLSFNSLWCDEAFPALLRENITQDAERMAFLSNQTSIFQIDSCDCGRFIWPFVFGKYPAQIQNSIFNKLKKGIVAPFVWVSKFFSYYVFKQFSGWAYVALKLICREKKFLKVFVLLAICCAISIQIGAGNGASGNESLLSLTSLCSPWLCATYAAIFVAGLLPTFSWEHFSGLRTRSFTAGILSGLLVPCMLISLVFTLSLFWRIDNNWIGKKIYENLIRFKFNKTIRYFLTEENEKEYIENCLSNENWRANTHIFAIPSQYNLGKAQLGVNGQGKYVYKEQSMCNYNEKKDNEERSFSVAIDLREKCSKNERTEYPQTLSIQEPDDLVFLPAAIIGDYYLSDKLHNNYPYYEHICGDRTFYLFHVKDSQKNWWGISECMYEDSVASFKEENFTIFKSSNLGWEDNLLSGRYIYKVPMISPLKFFFMQWLTMAILSFIGMSMGIAAISYFRDIKAATICLVILFIAFIVFSRAFIEQTNYMYSLPKIGQGQLDYRSMKCLLPIVLSFLGFGRYSFNVMAYPSRGIFLLDWLPLLTWFSLSIIVAQINLSIKIKNWEEISR